MSTPLFASYIALWALVLVETAALFALYHHFGEMYLNSRPGRENAGPEEGEEMPRIEAHDLNGEPLRLPAEGRPSIVFFAETSCRLCTRLRPEVAEFGASRADDLEAVVICAGKERAVAEWAEELVPHIRVVADPTRKLATRYRIGLTPFLVGADASGTVRLKGLVNDGDGFHYTADALLSVRPADELAGVSET